MQWWDFSSCQIPIGLGMSPVNLFWRCGDETKVKKLVASLNEKRITALDLSSYEPHELMGLTFLSSLWLRAVIFPALKLILTPPHRIVDVLYLPFTGTTASISKLYGFFAVISSIYRPSSCVLRFEGSNSWRAELGYWSNVTVEYNSPTRKAGTG